MAYSLKANTTLAWDYFMKYIKTSIIKHIFLLNSFILLFIFILHTVFNHS